LEFDPSKSGITRQMISQCIAAGILSSEEVRHAERRVTKKETAMQTAEAFCIAAL